MRREELVEFAEHLRCRLVTQYRRLRAVRHTQAAEVAAETQGSLF